MTSRMGTVARRSRHRRLRVIGDAKGVARLRGSNENNANAHARLLDQRVRKNFSRSLLRLCVPLFPSAGDSATSAYARGALRMIHSASVCEMCFPWRDHDRVAARIAHGIFSNSRDTELIANCRCGVDLHRKLRPMSWLVRMIDVRRNDGAPRATSSRTNSG